MSGFKTLHEVIAAHRELPAMASEDKRNFLRDDFANFVYWEANGHELDALIEAIALKGYVSPMKRPGVAAVTKSSEV